MGAWARSGAVLFAGLVACGASSSAAEAQQYNFTDAKGRQCTHSKYGVIATCNAPAGPSNGCDVGSHPCFVVYAGRLEREGPAASGKAAVWNCDACCKDGASSVWTGTTTDCSSYMCKTREDCASEEGTCESGQCHTTP
jgi:hypothetical protein